MVASFSVCVYGISEDKSINLAYLKLRVPHLCVQAYNLRDLSSTALITQTRGPKSLAKSITENTIRTTSAKS